MEQNTTPSLDGKKIDRDTFQRVWDRVMPDQTNSPIAVERRGESTPSSDAAVPAESAPAPEPEPEQPSHKVSSATNPAWDPDTDGFTNPEDFYDWYYDEFFSYEDAEDYYNEHS